MIFPLNFGLNVLIRLLREASILIRNLLETQNVCFVREIRKESKYPFFSGGMQKMKEGTLENGLLNLTEKIIAQLDLQIMCL